ncbi:alpha/beta hydrolase [Paracoccus laeviglucosivorans]|uniref:Phospholipase/carboxylesterase n=1 Tax=Paracoccus laeviglucosivorans TaxID=1197861 RepID=A0A521D0H9_9RHOB|nr:alpha/beta hydrolase [Paracoccus laeviglucosivorans]SMO64511.1 phospholipase/carboxylesterase [Paracoccus laeviglucosivorans]
MTASAFTPIPAIVTKGSPLIFAFHGTGGDEHQFAGLVPQLWPGAGLVAPRGQVSEHGANRYFRRTGEGVYDMADLALRRDKMIAFVRSHLTPGVPAYAFGYSNGANILAAMTLTAPDLFDRVALLHPLIPWDPAPQPGLAGVRVLITGGTRDPIAPLSGTETLAHYYAAQGAHVQKTIHAGGHEIRPEEITTLKTAFED